jgi:hypothetical protein
MSKLDIVPWSSRFPQYYSSASGSRREGEKWLGTLSHFRSQASGTFADHGATRGQ